jgi:hypothetical protein
MQAILLALFAFAVAPQRTAAQRVGGSLGVSLTVLQPVGSRAIEVTGFHVNRDGTASFRTTAPTAAQVSQLVMTRVLSSANAFAPASQRPAMLCPDRAANAAECELSYRVDVGRSDAGGAPRDVQLRIEVLAVAGT